MVIKFSNQHLSRMRETNAAASLPLAVSSKAAMNGFLADAYARNALRNVDEFYGLVVYQMVRSNPSADCFGSQVVEEGNESKSVNDYQSYKVYIPELECRPFPETYTDPVISTYREMCAATGILTAVGIGSIVVVKFLNFATLGRPLIVGVEGAIEGGMVPVQRTTLSTSHSGGPKKNIPFNPNQRAMVVGDSMSQTPGSFGGWLGRFLQEAGFEVKPATERTKDGGTGTYPHPAGVISYPGEATSHYASKAKGGANSFQEHLAKWRPQLLIVALGANSASLGIPQGSYSVGRRCRGPAIQHDTPAGSDDETVFTRRHPDGTPGGCRKQGPLAPKKAKYQSYMKEFVNIAKGAGVQRIIWFGPSYMSGPYGNVPFKVTKRAWKSLKRSGFEFDDKLIGKERDWGTSGLEEGAKNVRLWQKETLPGLGVEWYDSYSMTRELSNRSDGLHWDQPNYKIWAQRAWGAAFSSGKAADVLTRSKAMKAVADTTVGFGTGAAA